MKVYRQETESLEDKLDLASDDEIREVDSHTEKQLRFATAKPVPKQPIDFVYCTCDRCNKLFVKKPDEKSMICPHCGYKFEAETLEEMHTLGSHLTSEQMMALVEGRKFDRLISETRRRVDWENDDRDQHSILPGSVGYDEYVQDLREQHQEKQGDTFHKELESHNEDLVTSGYETKDENPESDDRFEDQVLKERLIEEGEKRALHPAAVKLAMAAALGTKSKVDDEIARTISPDNVVMDDRTVDADEYPEALRDYVMEIGN